MTNNNIIDDNIDNSNNELSICTRSIYKKRKLDYEELEENKKKIKLNKNQEIENSSEESSSVEESTDESSEENSSEESNSVEESSSEESSNKENSSEENSSDEESDNNSKMSYDSYDEDENNLITEIILIDNNLIEKNNKKKKENNIKLKIKPKNKKKKEENLITNIINKLVEKKNKKSIDSSDPEYKYFLSLSKKKQKELIVKQKEIDYYYNNDTPLRFKILDSDLTISSKAFILNKLNHYQELKPYESEYYKLKNWHDNLVKVPFNIYVEAPIKLTDSDKKISKFLYNFKNEIEETLYGQERVKNKLLQIMAQWIKNPKSKIQMIALEGPPGVGKTSLIKNGVSKVLKRPFNFVALGGATDSTFLEGHSYTYEGATYGKIVEMIIQSKVMNPIIFFDELDKVSSTPKGEEINGILTHLTDPSQNNVFSDKYFSGIEFDLSRIMYFFSFNNENLINPILKDRLNIIKFDNYKVKDKIQIALKYLIPEIKNNVNLEEIIFTEEIIKYIIDKFVQNEEGVRNLKRCLEEIIMKLNLLKMLNVNENIVKFDYHIDNLSFPVTLTREHIDKLLIDYNKTTIPISVQQMYI